MALTAAERQARVRLKRTARFARMKEALERIATPIEWKAKPEVDDWRDLAVYRREIARAALEDV